MKLYYSKGACSLAVRITLNEIEIPCDYEAVDLKAKKTETGADYFKINPKGSVPALVLDNQEILTENAAIQQYLADTYKATRLLPAVGNFNRYRVIEWLNFISTDLHKNCSPLFNPNIPDNLKEEIFKPTLKNKLKIAEQRLSQRKFLMGDEYMLPDSYLFIILRWVPNFGIELAEWPNLSRYFAELKQRKSVHQALAQEGLLK